LAYPSDDESVHGDRLQTFMSASLWSAMSPQAPGLPLPELSTPASRAVPSAPPTPPARVPSGAAGPTPAGPGAAKEGSGTGFFINAEGYVLTNAHVVDECSRIELPGAAESSPVRVIAKDKTNDLALVKTGVTPQKFALLRTGVRLGEQVAAFGYPLMGVLSSSGNFTLGNVTSLTGLRDDVRYLQISTPCSLEIRAARYWMRVETSSGSSRRSSTPS
jgi:S1-C subfamily serine protease